MATTRLSVTETATNGVLLERPLWLDERMDAADVPAAAPEALAASIPE
ncbi:hypothetical protein G6M89_05640 [Natronolimnobius sp. AArcel1]|nr:hypothetical protein [Natronolimnobius sp. AArcel1]NGM68497.1 hypothetical protein [Natronolimnobius sp. AArcel1]